MYYQKDKDCHNIYFCEKGDGYAKYKDHNYQKGKDLQTYSKQKIGKERLHCKGEITL